MSWLKKIFRGPRQQFTNPDDILVGGPMSVALSAREKIFLSWVRELKARNQQLEKDYAALETKYDQLQADYNDLKVDYITLQDKYDPS